MNKRQLIIGNKNYSSWSLRPWLFMKYYKLPFEEVRIPLYCVGSTEKIARYSPSGLVPALVDGDITVWDTLAICEYLSETYLDGKAWPQDRQARAHARAVSAEMHSGFANVRKHLSMNVRARFQWQYINSDVEREIARILTLWETCRTQFASAGPWLFGEFSIADAMYVPVCLRFDRYNVPLNALAQAYVEHVLALDAMREWCEAALLEKEVIGWAENAQLLRVDKI
ncbi:MAG: glutathione S-transferase family protein [Pseudomonadota bacterium]